MNQKVIDQTVEESAKAIRHMAANNEAIHAFDIGTLPDGNMLSMLMVIATRELVDQLLEKMSGSKPVNL